MSTETETKTKTAAKAKTDKTKGREGKKVGGDDAPTFGWLEADSIGGRLMTVAIVKTKFGNRTRLTLDASEPVKAEGIGDEKGDIVTVPAGGRVGMWMPDRWSVTLDPLVNHKIRVYRDVEGTQVRYDVRDLG